MTARENVTQVQRLWGKEWSCLPGQVDSPTGCERHANHFWCTTCEGYYGVPHDNIHDGPNKHPRWGDGYCACRPCREKHGAR